ncbi:MAG: transcription antitermination factor NusB [Candidatus Taylorbacteria bacterium]|nr:transcription antitermination factor NusB [Candidatus Taylorbacteria bacterium]
MANRHLSRSVVLQSLFEWDFRGRHDEEIKKIVARNAEEYAPGMGDFSFIEDLAKNIISKRPDLDNVIEKAAPDWPLDKISPVDRNILRLGLYELIFANRDEVPAKVAINESIELAKTFGGENSSKFINGVLGSVYKELGEPGKDAAPRKKKVKIPDIPYEKMPIQKLGGAVVYAHNEGEIYLALVHDVFGHWTLSKGKIEPDEDVPAGTIREIKEEMGLDIEIIEDLGSNEYIASDPEKGKLRKQVHYYLGKANFDQITLGTSGGLDDARWFRLTDILELNFYNDILPIVTKAVMLLTEKKTAKEKVVK